jgi:hypothetical protein
MYVPPIPGFDIDTALRTLNITRTSFDEMNGNIQGYRSPEDFEKECQRESQRTSAAAMMTFFEG